MPVQPLLSESSAYAAGAATISSVDSTVLVIVETIVEFFIGNPLCHKYTEYVPVLIDSLGIPSVSSVAIVYEICFSL